MSIVRLLCAALLAIGLMAFQIDETKAQLSAGAEASTKALVTAINTYADVIGSDGISEEDFLRVRGEICSAFSQVVETKTLDEFNKVYESIYSDARSEQQVIFTDGRSFQNFIIEERKTLVEYGFSENAAQLSVIIMMERRNRAASPNAPRSLSSNAIVETVSISCSESFIKANQEVESRELDWLWGAGKFALGLGIMGVDVSSVLVSGGLSAPLAAASGGLGAIVAGDGYSDLKKLW